MEPNITLPASTKAQLRQAVNALATHMPGYRERPGQLHYMADVAKAFEPGEATPDGRHVALLNAGTGVGKTAGYLIPGIIQAKNKQKKLIISTPTVALQQQIIERYLPAISRYTGMEINAKVAKGRKRYVCHLRLANAITDAGQGDLFVTHVATDKAIDQQQTMVRWWKALDDESWSGDRDKTDEPHTPEIWNQVSTDATRCLGKQCPYIKECAYFKAKAAWLQADVVVANHDLVLADLSTPEHQTLGDPSEAFFIFDEAHQLPKIASAHLTDHVDVQQLREHLEAGMVALQQHKSSAHLMAGMQEVQRRAMDIERGTPKGITKHRWPHGHLDAQTESLLEPLLASTVQLTKDLGAWIESESIEDEPLEMFQHYMGNIDEAIQQLLTPSTEQQPLAKWMERQGTHVTLGVAELDIGQKLHDMAWSHMAGVVLTSATLTACGSFEFFADAVGLRQAGVVTRHVPSPFDYQSMSQLVVPNIRVDPRQRDQHETSLVEWIPKVLPAEGGTLVLFNSRRVMQTTYTKLPPDVRERILCQGDMPTEAMLQEHRARIAEGELSILFGLESLAEGLDLPGQECVRLIVTALPFSPPDHPVDEARAEWLTTAGRDPFTEITVPKASIRLTQWTGRLIRTETDEGIIVVLDPRLMTKQYGAKMLENMPPHRLVSPLKKVA